MIERIDIKNYQSLHNISLEMGKFTVIFGDSDVGKSAVYRAIRGLVTAEDGDSFITEGKPKTGVSLLTPTSEVVWIKSRGKSSTYHLYLDGVKTREWNRARSLPLELAKGLMFGQMVVDGDKFYPNFRGQFDPLFMLFESSGKRARLLGSLVSNLLLKGIKIANVERNRVEADIRAMSGLAETLEKKLEVDWSALETKAVAVNKFACIIEKQVHLLVQIEVLTKEREVVVDGLELGKDFRQAALKVLHELNMQISGLGELEALELLKQNKVYCEKILAFKPVLPDVAEFDKAIRIEEMYDFVVKQTTSVGILSRDLDLSVFELKRLNKEIKSLDKDIKKLEVDKYVKCPYCHKEFQL